MSPYSFSSDIKPSAPALPLAALFPRVLPLSYDLLLSACDFFVAKRRYTSSKENLIKLFQGKPRLDLNKFF